MPLIILSGYPSSGKTRRARQIVEDFERRIRGDAPTLTASAPVGMPVFMTDHTLSFSSLTLKNPTLPLSPPLPSESAALAPTPSIPSPSSSALPSKLRVHYISDHTLHLARTAYATARAEKDARAALYSAVKRALGRDDIVVLDSGNYIKGWRYQLHCEAKALSTPSCVVHIGTNRDVAAGINADRLARLEEAKVGGEGEEDAYEAAVFEELVMRFEEPNAMARWDSPLFTVLWEDEMPPCDGIWEAMVESRGKDGSGRARVVRPNQATMLTPAAPPNNLYDLDRTTTQIVAHIQSHLADHADSPGSTLSIPLGRILQNLRPSTSTVQAEDGDANDDMQTMTLTLTLPTTPLTVSQLQRMRRQFIAMQRQQSGGMGVLIGGDSGRDGGTAVGVGSGVTAKKAKKMSERERLARLFIAWLGDAFGG